MCHGNLHIFSGTVLKVIIWQTNKKNILNFPFNFVRYVVLRFNVAFKIGTATEVRQLIDMLIFLNMFFKEITNFIHYENS